jgi:hypothetical protein
VVLEVTRWGTQASGSFSTGGVTHPWKDEAPSVNRMLARTFVPGGKRFPLCKIFVDSLSHRRTPLAIEKLKRGTAINGEVLQTP